jgi:hypothetical protein
MTRSQMLAAGLILAAGLTAGEVLFGGGSEADAQTRPLSVDLRDVELRGAYISILPDAGCAIRADYIHKAPVGELSVNVASQDYAFGGARCGVAKDAMAKAAARDLKFTDAGTP